MSAEDIYVEEVKRKSSWPPSTVEEQFMPGPRGTRGKLKGNLMAFIILASPWRGWVTRVHAIQSWSFWWTKATGGGSGQSGECLRSGLTSR